MKKLLYNDQIAHLKYHGKYYRTVLMKIITIVMVCSIICITVCSCESAFINDEINKAVKDDIPITGHILYGYKNDLMVYGQYMDQAGENNAMVLVFVEKGTDSYIDVCSKSVLVNGVQVESSVTIEKISPLLSTLQIHLTSVTTNIDQLSEDDNIALQLEIIDAQSNTTIEVTEPIIFSCN